MDGTDPLDSLIEKTQPDIIRQVVRAVARRLKRDSDHFILPSQDQHGHTEPVRFNAQPGWIRTVAALVQNPKYPFRAAGDYYRWAIHIGFQVLLELDPDGGTVERQAEIMLRTIRQRDRIIEMQDIFNQACDRISHLRRKGFPQEASKLCADLKKSIDEMNPGEAKNAYLAMFDTRLSQFVSSMEVEYGPKRVEDARPGEQMTLVNIFDLDYSKPEDDEDHEDA